MGERNFKRETWPLGGTLFGAKSVWPNKIFNKLARVRDTNTNRFRLAEIPGQQQSITHFNGYCN
jgi:hypothetical protein